MKIAQFLEFVGDRQFQKLKINIEEGINVIIKGRVTTYSPQSKYQLIVEQVKYQGEGALLQILEDRKSWQKRVYSILIKKKSLNFQIVLE